MGMPTTFFSLLCQPVLTIGSDLREEAPVLWDQPVLPCRSMRKPKADREKQAETLRKLHPIEAFGNVPVGEGDIRVERLEKRLTPKVPFPHKHDFYHFVYLESGVGWHEIDFVRFPARPGLLFLMRPGEVHSWSLGAKTRGFVLEFSRSSLGPNGQLLDVLDRLPSLVEGASRFARLLSLLQEEFARKTPDSRRAMEHLLAVFLLWLGRLELKARPDTAKPSSLVGRFRELVERHFHERHEVEFYAQRLGTTTKRLTTQVSRLLGKPAGAVIQDRCLVEAKRLLSYTELPVAEIGYKLGFDDPNYFARFFRQRAGMAPGRFRSLAVRTVPI